MSAFAEFILIALALYLWESTLWLPLRGVALRRSVAGGKWRVLDARAWFAGRELGLIPLLPVPPDAGLAPCQAPPLVVGDDGAFLIDTGKGVFQKLGPLGWEDLRDSQHHLEAGGSKVRVSSHRSLEMLRRAKARGASSHKAVRQAWRLALSPGRAGREWRRWRLVSGPLRWYGPLLTLGFFGGLPAAYVFLGTLQTLLLALWLWFLMAWTAGHLWWLAKRVYPGARGALRMDALLSLMVPFHAMRALEIASVHAMGTTHPVALVLWSGDLENPWLGGFVRRILHPAPGVPEEAAFRDAVLPVLARALETRGKTPQDYEKEPDRADDPGAAFYCPRCHGVFVAGTAECRDCGGVALRKFDGA